MDQEQLNRNFTNALSMINNGLMSLQERMVIILQQSNNPRANNLIELTIMDIHILNQLQISLTRMKELLK